MSTVSTLAPGVTVVNVRRLDPQHAPPSLVYCGRQHPSGWAASPLANPFSVREHGRCGAMARYVAWLADAIEQPTPGPAALLLVRLAHRARNEALRLGCWCSPLDCHCDRLTDVIGWINGSGKLLPEHAWMLRHGCSLAVAYDARAAWNARHQPVRPPLWDWVRPGIVTPADVVAAAQRRTKALPL